MIQWEYCLASLVAVPDRPLPFAERMAHALTAVEGDLDQLGQDGWEAVGPVTVESLHGSDRQHATVLLLKRPVQPADAVPQGW